ncbi:MAG: YqhA family protein [Acetobacteraceae bacterium]
MNLEDHPDKPDWIGHIGFSDLKIKLLASIVAISAIQLLELFMHVEDTPDRVLIWSIGLHVTFLVSGMMLALMDRVSDPPKG